MPTHNGRKIGDIEVTTVSDGVLNSTLTNFLGIEQAEASRLSGFPVQGPVPLAVNAYLLKVNGKYALVDAGSGSTMGPTLGKLPDNLRTLGVAPAEIDYVLLTHIHPDHSNGLTDDAGTPYFPNAEVIVGEPDAAFFLDRDPTLGENEFRQRSMRAAQHAFAPYRGRTRRITSGEILPGISAHPQPGHTLGHTGWLVSSRNDALLIWGDIVHVVSVQFERPEAALTFDYDPEMARQARRRVFDWVATDQIRIAGAHLDLPGYGYVERGPNGYAFTADP
jgi:glyoxylase-like metal-dependent hydrolase (beta-lactamase superfamily II)